jgi:hypothetical protein
VAADLARGCIQPPGFPRGLHGRQQHRNQYADDGNDDEQLDQREAAVSIAGSPSSGRRRHVDWLLFVGGQYARIDNP